MLKIKELPQTIKAYYIRLKDNKQARQSFTLLSWNIIGILLGIFTNVVVTRYMGAEDYGNYLYINRVFNFAFIILSFGIVQSINRAILLSKDATSTKEYYGSGFLLIMGVYLFSCLALFLSTFCTSNYEAKGILDLFYLTIPFSIAVYLSSYFDQVLPSSNNIGLLIVTRYMPKVLFFFACLSIYYVFMNRESSWNRVLVVWTCWIVVELVSYAYVFYSLHPSFRNIPQRVREIFKYEKSFGFQIYVGNIFSNAFSALIPIFLSYVCTDNTNVGFYSLSLTISMPLTMIPAVISTSYYKNFANYKQIPPKLLKTTAAMSLLGLACVWVLVTPFVKILYTSEFEPVIGLTFITSIGALLYGLSDFFSRFLMAHGQGKALRNSSFIVGFVTLAGSLLFVPWLKGTGAAISYVCAGITYVLVILYYYKKDIKQNEINNQTLNSK